MIRDSEQKMDKNVMVQYLKYIDSEMTDGDIFKMVRDIEIPTPDNYNVTNWDEFYRFLRDHRDTLKNG